MNGLSNSSAGSSSFEHADESDPDSTSEEPSPPDPTPQPSIAVNTAVDADVNADVEPAVCIAWHRDIDQDLDAWLADKFAAIATLTGVHPAAVSLAIVNDDEMVELHEQYKGVPGTTDVLTFDLREETENAEIDTNAVEGDVILCYDEANRQAKQRGHALSHELLLYAVHGLLHLLGYDDHDETAAATMHAREDALLSEIGLGPVFATRIE